VLPAVVLCAEVPQDGPLRPSEGQALLPAELLPTQLLPTGPELLPTTELLPATKLRLPTELRLPVELWL
jgi:hypothetical protein